MGVRRQHGGDSGWWWLGVSCKLAGRARGIYNKAFRQESTTKPHKRNRMTVQIPYPRNI